MSENTASEKKRRWYHNMADAYRVTARTYPWVAWALIGSAAATVAVIVLIGVVALRGNWILWTILGVFAAATVAMSLLSFLVRRAVYQQIDGTAGAVKAVLDQIRSGWIIPEAPVHVTREQDIVWRVVGRAGVVFISEGPSSRVQPMLATERKRAQRIIQNVPVHVIQVGKEEGQVPLAKLQSRLRSLKKQLTKEEVPLVSARLSALRSNDLPIPKGIDPMRARPNRRAMRGR
ncbi:DUF4191 domain-containing protein [Actinomyces sp. B33]|uniref:DUF4191 domain-containing protein n=1 Tax=Actinomyces sp. B33 TaxID=2942131 RepID=UPI002340F513|nr:DUF4191 domain-containing protein [Actinomyces sp. B33]MDC4233373.1 DUF4191 domain-containing protein [Actinomyces sp. B33]